MDKRERVARAIWAKIDKLDQLPLHQQPDTSTIESQMEFTRMLADAAIAAIEPETLQDPKAKAEELHVAASNALHKLEQSMFSNSEHEQAKAILRAALKQEDD